MGTRADFYVGKGLKAEWLGSIAWDGYPEGIPTTIASSRTEKGYRDAVISFLDERDDATKPEQGWPWPWKTSHTTDCAYTFTDDEVWCTWFGRPWRTIHEVLQHIDDEDWNGVWSEESKTAEFPDMSDRQKVTMGARSGLIILSR